MEFAVRIGGSQLTVLEVLPGVPDEGQRLAVALRRIEPAVVGVDASLDDVHRGRESFFASLVRESLGAQGMRGREVPALVARDHARRHDAELVPLLGATDRPSWWTRRHVTREVASMAQRRGEPRAIADGVRRDATEVDPDVARLLLAGEQAMAAALRQLLVEEQRTRVAAVITYPRSERVVGLLLGKPVRGEVAQVAHGYP